MMADLIQQILIGHPLKLLEPEAPSLLN